MSTCTQCQGHCVVSGALGSYICDHCGGSGYEPARQVARAASANETGAEGAKPIGFRTRVPGFAWVPWLTDDQETIQRAIADALAHGHEGEAIYGAPVPAMAAEAVASSDGTNTWVDEPQRVADVGAQPYGATVRCRRCGEQADITFTYAAPQRPAQADAREGLTDEQLRKALSSAWNLGQTYWQQADSEYASQNRKSDATRDKYLALVEETCALLKGADHADQA